MSVYCCKRIFRYRLSPETFGYTIIKLSLIVYHFETLKGTESDVTVFTGCEF